MFERERSKGSPSESVSPASGATSAFIGKGSRISGTVALEGPGRIEGAVEGEIQATDSLTIGEEADVKAKITGTVVIVHGRVTGDVVATTRLELRAPAKLLGNIQTPNLLIEPGSSFDGQCSMKGAKGAGVAKAQPSAPSRGAGAPPPPA